MKKYLFCLATLALGLTACENYFDEKYMDNGDPQISVVKTYDYTLALRGVTTSDFMTADWARIPYEVLDKVSTRIVNEVKNINRIVYDITSKPPATVEWE